MAPDEKGVVYRASTRAEAEWIRTVLEENGISSWVEADDCGGTRPEMLLLGEALVRVSLADELAAARILKSIRPEDEI